MTFDKQEHKELVLNMLKQANVPVALAALALELLKAVESANIAHGKS